MSQQSARICILGGGFGGLHTALRLNQLPWPQAEKPEIVLVDQRDRFLFSPLLYELITGELQTWEIAPPFEEVLAGSSIRFCQARVVGVDVQEQRVQLQDGPELPYDRVLIALGGETPLDIVPGAVEYAIPFRNLAHVYRLEERLRLLEESEADKIRVVVVGAGYSGVELACKLNDRLGARGRIRLIEQTDQILRTSPEFNRTVATQALEERGIWLDLETTVESVGPDNISLLYKSQVDTIPADLVLWTVGTRISPIVQSLPFKQDAAGKLTVLPTLQVVDHPEVFAAGDSVTCQDAEGQQVPATAQAAYQQAEYAAWNIWASLTNRPQLPFRYQHLGELLSLGTQDAVISSFGFKLTGSAAYAARRLAYLARMPSLDHQLKVGFNWITQPIRGILSA